MKRRERISFPKKDDVSQNPEACLKAWQKGDGKGFARLVEAVYDSDLVPMAKKLLVNHQGPCLEPEELVSLTFSNLSSSKMQPAGNIDHFLQVFGIGMRKILLQILFQARSRRSIGSAEELIDPEDVLGSQGASSGSGDGPKSGYSIIGD